MAEKEYIEREALIRYAEKQEVIIKDGTSIADAMRIQGNVFRRYVETCPAADVVPKSEVDWNSIPVDVSEALKQRAVEKAKTEVAREIFMDIDRVVEKYSMGDIEYPAFLNIIAELKKKYTEEVK